MRTKNLVEGVFADNLAYLAISIVDAFFSMKSILHLRLPFCDARFNEGSKSRSLCVGEWEKLQLLLTSHYKDMLLFLV